MKTSARNQFIGKVKSVKHGPINAEVILGIGGGDELAAVITRDSAEHLGLIEGMEVHALIKAPWIIVTTDDSIGPAPTTACVDPSCAVRKAPLTAKSSSSCPAETGGSHRHQ